MTPLLSVLQDVWAQLYRRRPGRALELEEDLDDDVELDDDSDDPPPVVGGFGARRTPDGAYGVRQDPVAPRRGWPIALPDDLDELDEPIGGRHGR